MIYYKIAEGPGVVRGKNSFSLKHPPTTHEFPQKILAQSV